MKHYPGSLSYINLVALHQSREEAKRQLDQYRRLELDAQFYGSQRSVSTALLDNIEEPKDFLFAQWDDARRKVGISLYDTLYGSHLPKGIDIVEYVEQSRPDAIDFRIEFVIFDHEKFYHEREYIFQPNLYKKSEPLTLGELTRLWFKTFWYELVDFLRKLR